MKQDSYLSIFLTFLRFGLLAWGGPVAQIAMIRDELVERRGWITQEKFRRTNRRGHPPSRATGFNRNTR